jgi:hypothetical protein
MSIRGREWRAGDLGFAVLQRRGDRTLGWRGESITIPPNTPHHFWNHKDIEAHAVHWFRLALKTRSFFESLTRSLLLRIPHALAQDGELDEKGMPSLLQVALMIPDFSDELRPTGSP